MRATSGPQLFPRVTKPLEGSTSAPGSVTFRSQVDDLPATLGRLSEAGLKPGPVERPGGLDGAQISWLTDPDGYWIELVQWPPWHP